MNLQMDKKTAAVLALISAELTIIALSIASPEVALKFMEAMAPWAQVSFGG